MPDGKHFDEILRDWPYDPDGMGVRLVDAGNERQLIQIRVDMGILQLETSGRPDGTQPYGHETYYDFLLGEALREGEDWQMDDEQCSEVDREFIQFYHRRVSWIKLKKYRRAIQDANHTLGLMDLCHAHSPDEHWTISHEQYRPFVMFHRTQAEAFAGLEEEGAEKGIQAINHGLDRMQDLFEQHEAAEYFEDDELVMQLVEMRESMRDEYGVGQTLQERLADAVAKEEFELAAQLRDQLSQQSTD
jgi:hypothetical protein